MKNVLIIIAAIVMGLSLIGCGIKKSDGTEETTKQEPTTQEQTTQETTTQAPVSGSDPVIFQLNGIDEDLGWNWETGLDAIILTESGRLTLMTYGELASNEGKEVTIADDALGADIFEYGNGGYRVVLFVRRDGSVSMVDPETLIEKHKIQIVDNLGGLKNIVEIYEQSGEDGTVVYAKDRDGSETMLDPFF